MDRVGSIRNEVLFGNNNFLFLHGGGQKQFDYLTGVRRPTSSSILNFFSNLRHRKVFCDARNIRYQHIVFPSKPVICGQMLPIDWQERVQSLFLREYASYSDRLTNEFLLYPKEVLSAIEPTTSVFRTLDTHMTDVGNYLVAQNSLSNLGVSYDFDRAFHYVNKELSGDLAQMVGSNVRYSEEVATLNLPIFTFDNRPYLPGNTNNIVIVYSPASSTAQRLLVLGDSFIKDSLKFYAPVYREILYVRTDVFQADLLELFRPSAVITANAERYLATVRSDNESLSMMLASYGENSYNPSKEFSAAYKAQLSFAHHPGAYKEWARSIEMSTYDFVEMSRCVLNKHIQIIDRGARSFSCTGDDPSLTFLNLPNRAGTKYQLEVQLQSSANSIAVVYFTDANQDSFSEARTVRQKVNVGRNKLIFSIPANSLGRRLRFDPLACPGELRIEKISLRPVS